MFQPTRPPLLGAQLNATLDGTMRKKYTYTFTDGTDALLAGTAYEKTIPPVRGRSVVEIETFVTMLRVACEDGKINAQLERILSLPDQERRALIHTWVSDMLIADAPKDFVEAIACLSDDQVAEKAYEVIFKCKR